MARDPRQLVEAFVRAVDDRDMDAMADLLDPDFVDRTPVAGQDAGPTGFVRDKLGALVEAFPDLTIEAGDTVVEGERVAWRWTVRGTNTGSFAGHRPTGRSVSFQGLNLERLVDGRIQEHWSIHDTLTMLDQLALLPAVAATS